MKKLIKHGIIVFAVTLLAVQILQAQGTVYLSNLGQPSAGSSAVGSDSWLAFEFNTGTNASGYMLNTVQLEMTNASGNPGGFTAMLYNMRIDGGGLPVPRTNLDTLNGSLNPVASGTYTYTQATNLVLLPNAGYWIVLTAETAITNAAYESSYAGASSYNPNGGWSIGLAGSVYEQSSDGLNWGEILGKPQFAINATPIPEPSTISLIVLSSGLFLYARHKHKNRGKAGL